VIDEISMLVGAYADLAAGDPSKLVGALDPDVEWWTRGVKSHDGREEVKERLVSAAGAQMHLVGIRREANLLSLEFSQPWWSEQSRRSRLVHSWLDVRGELTLQIENGRIARIEAREPLAEE
jgi:hypothetical protein